MYRLLNPAICYDAFNLFWIKKPEKISQGKYMHQKNCSIFSHPDFTVGTGISPVHALGARGLYRRYGISPNPEDLLFNLSFIIDLLPVLSRTNFIISGLALTFSRSIERSFGGSLCEQLCTAGLEYSGRTSF